MKCDFIIRMHKFFRDIAAVFIVGFSALHATGQSAPATPDKSWHGKAEDSLNKQLSALPDTKYSLDPAKAYTL